MNSSKGERAAIGARLRAAREAAHITVEDAAKALEVQPLALERWERGAALPSLIEFKGVIQLYGIMCCDVLFAVNPWILPREEAAELARTAKAFSPSLRAKVDCILALSARGIEPVWRKAA